MELGWLQTWWPIVAISYFFVIAFIVFVELKRPKDPTTTWGFVEVNRKDQQDKIKDYDSYRDM
ncbi:hypothetical protein ACJ2A9_01065 [Anaerobacillus sp. MEB173]|uniref:hypothetical protein n=1 Tax=Anaerobacillus sp. MEB173 TaxID=3383345 RepID=UPI003F8F1CEB